MKSKLTNYILISILLIIMTGIFSCSNEDSIYIAPADPNFAALTDDEQEEIMVTSMDMLDDGMALALYASLYGSGGGGSSFTLPIPEIELVQDSFTCNDTSCSGTGSANGPDGGEVSFSGTATYSTSVTNLEFNFTYIDYSEIIDSYTWEIDGDVRLSGSLNTNEETVYASYRGTANITSLYGVFECGIDMSYSLSDDSQSVYGTWCGIYMSY